MLKRYFTPEFRNRLDAVIPFRSLNPEVVYSVVDKFLIELEGLLEGKRVTLDVSESAKIWLVEHGYDAKMGARPMARLIQEKLKKPLAEELLFGRLCNGGTVRVDVMENELALNCCEASSESLC